MPVLIQHFSEGDNRPANLLIPRYGWQIAFYIGVVPALYVFYLWKAVPESAMYQVKNGSKNHFRFWASQAQS